MLYSNDHFPQVSIKLRRSIITKTTPCVKAYFHDIYTYNLKKNLKFTYVNLSSFPYTRFSNSFFNVGDSLCILWVFFWLYFELSIIVLSKKKDQRDDVREVRDNMRLLDI